MIKLIKAKFRGLNGSLGYKTDETYTLFFKTNEGFLFFAPRYPVEIWRASHDRFSTGYCPYGSISKFIENWEVIEV